MEHDHVQQLKIVSEFSVKYGKVSWCFHYERGGAERTEKNPFDIIDPSDKRRVLEIPDLLAN